MTRTVINHSVVEFQLIDRLLQNVKIINELLLNVSIVTTNILNVINLLKL